MNKNIILAALILPVIMFPAFAEIYKWTDSEGNVHFGDRPTDVKSATQLNIKINKNSGVSTPTHRNKERAYLLKKIEEKKQADAEKKKENKATRKKRKQACNSYKRHYQSMLQSNRSYTMTPDGVRTYQSNEQRTKRMRELKRSISKHCR